MGREETFLEVITRTAEKFKLPIGLVKAMCRVESDFVSTAMRWEPVFYHKYVQPLVVSGEIPFEEAIGNACSFGLMQIMGRTARLMGYTHDLTGLWQPIINLNYCCKFLAKLMKRYGGNVRHSIAAYNAGSARMRDDGGYVNQGYVDKVCNAWMFYDQGEYQNAISGGGTQTNVRPEDGGEAGGEQNVA